MRKILAVLAACIISLSMVLPSLADVVQTEELISENEEKTAEESAEESIGESGEGADEASSEEISAENEGPSEEVITEMEEAAEEETHSSDAASEENQYSQEVTSPEETVPATENPAEETTPATENPAEETTPATEKTTEETSTEEAETEEESSKEETDEKPEIMIDADYEINPLYPDAESEEEYGEYPAAFSLADEEELALLAADALAFYSMDDVGLFLRQTMVARTATVSFVYYSETAYSDFNWKTTASKMVQLALYETGVSTEGDYLRWQYGGVSRSALVTELDPETSGGYGCSLYLTITFKYYTTAAQEALVTERLGSLYQELGLAEKSDYLKIRTIYDYITSHVVYDTVHTSTNPYYYLKHTAYAALIDGMAVCQGYALLFYRMVKDNGINARLVAGTAGVVNHGWNIVYLNGIYYYVDSTWDAGRGYDYLYFMKGSLTFDLDHHMRSDYTPYFDYNVSLNDLDCSLLDDDITDIKFVNESEEIAVGSTENFPVEITPADTRAKLVWTSSDEDIITVNKNGDITLNAYGKASVTAASPSGNVVAELEIIPRFSDVTDHNDPFFEPIYWAVDAGIAEGYSDGTFKPASAATRCDFVEMLYNFAGSPEVSGSMPFSDCGKYSADSNSYKAIVWAYNKGIVKGYSSGRFCPDKIVTRKQSMIMLYRYEGRPEVSGSLGFNDCSSYRKNSDSYKAILWGFRNGITNGTSRTTFGPDGSCLRRHVVYFLKKINNL